MKAYFHLPGLFEFYDFYKVFLPVFFENPEFFYDFCQIGSIYGAPSDCLWGGGRVGFGSDSASDVCKLINEYGISARLTFSNSLLEKEDLNDRNCNRLCEIFSSENNGIIIYSDLLLNYIKENYPAYYFVSSTTKVITDTKSLLDEINREEFSYVVPDFRLNKSFDFLSSLSDIQKKKLEFLCNECCSFECPDRKKCYEEVSRKVLGIKSNEHKCSSKEIENGYSFSKAMKNKGFISIDDIINTYMPLGFNNFKIEGRSLGSALILEFILHYMTKTEYQINVREKIYLDNSLDLF